jgi:hypothetical protein
MMLCLGVAPNLTTASTSRSAYNDELVNSRLIPACANLYELYAKRRIDFSFGT